MLIFVCVFRERQPTFMWRWTVLAAPAMVAPALGAAAEARAGHAATPLVAAKGLRITLPAVLVPALAPRFTFTKVMVCLRAGEEIFPLLNKSCKLSMDNLVLCSLGVFSYSPTFLLQFSFFSLHFCRADESGLCICPCFTLILPFSSTWFFLPSLPLHYNFLLLIFKYAILSFDLLVCLSVEFRGTG